MGKVLISENSSAAEGIGSGGLVFGAGQNLCSQDRDWTDFWGQVKVTLDPRPFDPVEVIC